MESTFDKFITNNPKEKAKFEKEYNDFLLSDFILERMEKENLSVRSLAKKADVSPTIIQKLRKSETAEKINYGTFMAVINSLGYKVKLVRL